MIVGRINGVVALTGFSYEEMYGRFFFLRFLMRKCMGVSPGQEKVVVITRWSY